jgi:hypothetical protein
MSRHVALIACSNGFGHARRTLALAQELLTRGHNVTWFGDEKAFQHFGSFTLHLRKGAGKLEACHFLSGTTAHQLRNAPSEAMSWHRRLPSLAGYDVVLCDNLPEVLLLRDDALLSGHFLWSYAFEDIPEVFKDHEAALLQRFSPTLLAGAPFTFPELKSYAGLKETGLSVFPAVALSNGVHQRSVLISSGRGGELETVVQSLVKRLLKEKPIGFDRIFVEPHALPSTGIPEWLQPADFTPAMFAQLGAAICRPGIGTVTDCLQNHVRIFAVAERHNREVTHNANVLEKLNLGMKCSNVDEALHHAQDHVADASGQLRQVEAVAANIHFDGHIQMADAIEARF